MRRTVDVDVEKVMKITKICHGELLTKIAIVSCMHIQIYDAMEKTKICVRSHQV